MIKKLFSDASLRAGKRKQPAPGTARQKSRLSNVTPGHFDLYRACRSMRYNLKTDRYNARVLDAYGCGRIDPVRMSLCERISRDE